MAYIAAALVSLMVVFAQDARVPEATSLLGKPLLPPALSPERRAALEKDLAAAQAEFDRQPGSADAAIWLGRRTAYLGRYRDAIRIFSDGIAKHPSDARLYRHRGHRYISIRDFDKAVTDLSRAAELVAGRADEVEPDGQPNAKNIPTSTLKTNIYYHLGLAHYLKGDFKSAREAYRLCRQHSKNPDMLVATLHWEYMTLQRLRSARAADALLGAVSADMPVIENGSYHKLLMMYKGAAEPDAVLAASKAAPLDAVTIGYGVANWHIYNGRPEIARKILSAIVEEHGATQWAGFGYIAAEADLARLR